MDATTTFQPWLVMDKWNTVFSYLCFIWSTLRNWDNSAAIQELFSFLGIMTKQEAKKEAHRKRKGFCYLNNGQKFCSDEKITRFGWGQFEAGGWTKIRGWGERTTSVKQKNSSLFFSLSFIHSLTLFSLSLSSIFAISLSFYLPFFFSLFFLSFSFPPLSQNFSLSLSLSLLLTPMVAFYILNIWLQLYDEEVRSKSSNKKEKNDTGIIESLERNRRKESEWRKYLKRISKRSN